MASVDSILPHAHTHTHTHTNTHIQQVSFVNSIATTRGGSHVNHVSDQLAQMYLDHLAKKHKGLKLKPFQV